MLAAASRRILDQRSISLHQWSDSLAHYDESSKWNASELATLLAMQENPDNMDLYDLNWLKNKTSLLPPALVEEVNERTIHSMVLGNKYYQDNHDDTTAHDYKDISSVLSMTDQELVDLFGIRSKEDLRIRRSRMQDVFFLYRECGKADLLLPRLRMLSRLDYITICNLLHALLLHPAYFENILRRLDAFKSLKQFTTVTSTINQLVKKFPCAMGFRVTMAEASNLVGYRGLPFPGFDPVKATKELCDGGADHGLVRDNWQATFTRCALKVMSGQTIGSVPFMTLEEYIASDKAETSGASSFGKVEYTFEGETEKFKARKNFLLDLYGARELYEKTIANIDKQTSSAFVKPELGKCRIAVTGDIWSYYAMSWLNYLCGHSYVSWQNNTLEEDRFELAQRMEKMVNYLKDKGWSLPFDYKGFDHQPTLWEVVELTRLYLMAGGANVPQAHTASWLDILNRASESFYNNECVIHVEGERYSFTVKGGLQSGIRLTSLLGNFWNQTMTEAAREVCDPLRQYIDVVYIRGDDSSVMTKSYFSCLCMRLAYQAINAVGHDAKYGIHYGNTEFLRVWYTGRRVYGYPNRAIPGLVQRKPWTSEAWDPDAITRSLFECIGIIERRLDCQLDYHRRMVINAWQRQRRLDARFLELPRIYGGLGLLPWQGWLSDKNYPRVSSMNVSFKVGDNTWSRYSDRYVLPLDEQQSRKMQQMELLKKGGADDLPAVNRSLRQKFVSELKRIGPVTWSRASQFIPDSCSDILTTENLRKLDRAHDLTVRDKLKPAEYGEFWQDEHIWNDLQLLKYVLDIKPMKVIEENRPAFYRALRQLESRGWHRSNALDFLFGKMSGYTVGNLHPMCASVISTSVATVLNCSLTKRFQRYSVLLMIQKAADASIRYLKTSPLYRKLYLW